MNYQYKTSGTCSRTIDFEIENGKVKNVRFHGGCDGNLKGISSIVEGMNAEDVIAKLEGIRCGFKSTSCPDQLAKAIRKAVENG
ncbi:MAG: TIGR03905 family TSCPD domain-containing protein [Ruminococcaceae bacterium]|nr:TIGR03905 family TSCPD domain-containing protein [Oscillospiraceae bacterium]